MEASETIPAIRFAGFTSPWEQRKLGECGSTYGGLSGKTKVDFGHGDARFVPYTNVFDNPVTDISRLGSVEIDQSQNEVRNGDALFTVSSETPEEVGMSSVWLSDQRNVYLNSFCFGYRQDGSFNSLFLAHMLRSQSVRVDMTLLAQGISRFNISKNKVMELTVPVPEQAEQHQIGAFFNQLDNLITLHQRKYEALKSTKQTMLEKMFPQDGARVPELRFPGFTGPWEQRKLGDFSQKRTAKNVERTIRETFTNSAEQGVISQLDFFDHNITNDASIDGYYLVKPDDFVYNPRISSTAPCGPINRNSLGRVGAMSPLYTVFEIDATVAASYLTYYFKTSLWHSFMLLEGNSGARSDRFSIADSTFFKMPISCPAREEQEMLAAFFSQLDNLITLHQRKYEALKAIKQALLQKMFV